MVQLIDIELSIVIDDNSIYQSNAVSQCSVHLERLSIGSVIEQ